jgi:virulence-associated protein VagC
MRYLSLIDITPFGFEEPVAARAKIFMHGRSQAVRLPKEFRLPGKEVQVSKVGDKVILEPMEKAPFDVAAWRAADRRRREGVPV